MTIRSVNYLPTLLLAFVLFLAGCDSTETEESIVGTYETESFTAEIEGATVNVLSAGGFVDMTLRADRSVEGRLFVPEAISGDEGFTVDVSLDGTYEVSGNQISFSQEEDTFIRDVIWSFDDGLLRAETDELSITLRKE